MSDYLEKVEQQLRELTEQRAHRRRRLALATFRRPLRLPIGALAFAGAAAAVVVVVAVVLSLHTAAPRHTAAAASAAHGAAKRHADGGSTAPHIAPSGPRARPGQVPAGFVVRSFTAIGELTWWLLGDDPRCPGKPCPAILRTDDGGRSFARLPAPHAPASSVSQLRFANYVDGFAFGPALYVTHDGGASWHALDLGGQVSDLAIAGGQVYAVVSSRLLRSPIGSDRWHVVAHGVAAPLWVHGTDVFVSSTGFMSLLLSHDRGRTFASYRTPSPGLPCSFQQQKEPVVWAQCVTGTESAVWRSTDGGRGWVETHCPSEPNSALFAVASSTTAVLGAQQLYRTGDAGNTYTPVGPSSVRWSYLGFTDATHGVALGSQGELYYTTDAGQSYHRVYVR